jgi:hypothetical protein
MCPWQPNNPVMPAQAGIHDFSVSVTKALGPGAARKSWMPAFAGMTGEGAAEGRRPSIRDFNRTEYRLFFFKKRTASYFKSRATLSITPDQS